MKFMLWWRGTFGGNDKTEEEPGPFEQAMIELKESQKPRCKACGDKIEEQKEPNQFCSSCHDLGV
jgi:hypothetical protein